MPTQPAILGTMRLGNFRLGYESAALAAIRATHVRILLAGTDVRVRVAGLTIRDILNDTPNTARLTIASPAPTTGQALRITINSDTPRLLFNGTIQTDDLIYEGKPTQLAYPCTAIDDTARANSRRPFGTWTLISATTIAQYLVTTYAPGFTSVHVQASLPAVTITFDGSEDFSTCLARLATMIGGYFYWEDGDLHFFQTEATDTPDALDSTPGRFLDNPPLAVSTDDSQLRTRVYGKGHGEALLSDVLLGETMVPVADGSMYNPLGGQVIAGTTPDGAVSQILEYAAATLGGTGSLVGPGATPVTAPVVVPAPGTGLGTGVYRYGYTDVTVGESLPSPMALVTLGTLSFPVTNPTAAVTLAEAAGSDFWATGDHIQLAVSFVTASGETRCGPLCTALEITRSSGSDQINVSGIPIGPSSVTQRKLYRVQVVGSVPTGNIYVVTLADNSSTTITALASGSLYSSTGVIGPASNTAGTYSQVSNQAQLSAIAAGPGGTTSRKVYRTIVNGSQLKLLTTLADNTTLTYLDAIADGSLGANAPTSDTSGLTQPSGQINAGNSFVIVASPAPFSALGGWAILGSQMVRYTGINSNNILRGIPESGPGAIVATVLYGSPVFAAPMLTGVSGRGLASSVHIADPITAPTFNGAFAGAIFGSGIYLWSITFVTAAGETLPGPSLSKDTTPEAKGGIALANIPLGATGTIARNVYRTVVGGAQLKFVGTVPGNVETSYSDFTADAGLGANAPTMNTSAVGPTGAPLALQKGSPVNIWVQRDDLAAQAAAVIRESTSTYTSTGLHEFLITDERRGEASLIARCDAELVLYSMPIVTVAYATRDVKTKSGKTIVVNLSSPPISDTLTIQEVTISEIDMAPRTAPKFFAKASTVRFSLEAILRQIGA